MTLPENYTLQAFDKRFPLNTSFRIARGAKSEAHSLIVEAHSVNGRHIGRGEATPYARYGESMQSALAQLHRIHTPDTLPAGAARNALDCALLDLAAKQNGTPVWKLLGLPRPRPCRTAITLPLGDAASMGEKARALSAMPLLKLKLAGDGQDADRLKAVRDAAPAPALILDGNEGFSPQTLEALLPDLQDANIALIEQPLGAENEHYLSRFRGAVPFCADESAHTVEDLPRLKPLYDAVNIKLDKTGGLRPAVDFAHAAKDEGMGLMVGCMVASSLAMAPALLLAPLADYVDLDGPLFLAEDHPQGLIFEGASILPSHEDLWGHP